MATSATTPAPTNSFFSPETKALCAVSGILIGSVAAAGTVAYYAVNAINDLSPQTQKTLSKGSAYITFGFVGNSARNLYSRHAHIFREDYSPYLKAHLALKFLAHFYITTIAALYIHETLPLFSSKLSTMAFFLSGFAAALLSNSDFSEYRYADPKKYSKPTFD